MIRIYVYKNCDSCRKALKWLRQHGLGFEELPIRETPPSKQELARMLEHRGGDLKALFNTSGRDYRELGLKDRISDLSFDEAAELLGGNGNLVKRPFLLSDTVGLVGFRETEWEQALVG